MHTYGFLEGVAVVHTETICGTTGKTTIVLVEGDAQHLQPLHQYAVLAMQLHQRSTLFRAASRANNHHISSLDVLDSIAAAHSLYFTLCLLLHQMADERSIC